MSIKNNEDGTYSSTQVNQRDNSNRKFSSREEANIADINAMFDNNKANHNPEGDAALGYGLMLSTLVLGGWAILYYCLVSPGLRAAYMLSFTDGVFGGVGSILTFIMRCYYAILFFPHFMFGYPLSWTPYIAQTVIIILVTYFIHSKWSRLKKKVLLFLASLCAFSFLSIGLLALNPSLWNKFEFFIAPLGL
ncbi:MULTISPECIES: hypothetical protein [unclassified Kosakonia]|uniref:hypothetical protein n=1 Tax=unclassified Kosakonia TaxID=2632876 RepID=UPI0031B680C7